MIPPSMSEILSAVHNYGPSQLAELLTGITPVLERVPLDALERFGEAAANAWKAKTELEAMKASVAAANAGVDAEEEALKQGPPAPPAT